MKNFLQSRSLVAALFLALAGCGGSDGGGGGGGDLKTGAATPTQSVSSTVASDGGAAPSSAAAPAAAAAASPASTALPPAATGLIESKVSLGSEGREVDPVKPRNAKVAPIPVRIALPGLSNENSRLQKSAPGTFGAPQKVGVARSIPETATAAQLGSSLAWTTSERGGKVAAIRFASTGALGVRLGLVVRALPFGAFVRFYADGSDTWHEIPGQEILSGINRNLAAGDSSDDARTYWSPNLRGAAVTMEIEIPASAKTSEVDVAIPSLSHFLVDTHKEGSIEKIGEAGTCNLDVACTSTYNQLSKSVALMEFMSGGTAYVCTGTLLNDRMSTGTPYFLTAKHCISNQTMASTITTIWFYTSSSCSSGVVSSASRVLTQGATLLYVSPDPLAGGVMQGDTSFLRLNQTPPAGALYAGSSPLALEASASVYGVHHPKGDVQKYSVGLFTGASECAAVSCGTPATTNANFMRVHWTQGVTESGSSGSGVFTRLNGKDYLVGQLLGGGSSCFAPASPDFYGRFATVAPALAPWLSAASTTTRLPVFRMYNTRDRTHFYTSDPLERDFLLTKSTIFNFEGVAFYAYGATAPGTAPVHRFYNQNTATHFYTIDQQEWQHVQAALSPPFRYDGVAWAAGTSAANGAAPMFRFYNRATKTHFYTMSEAERNYVQQNSTDFQLEGVAYYAWTP